MKTTPSATMRWLTPLAIGCVVTLLLGTYFFQSLRMMVQVFAGSMIVLGCAGLIQAGLHRSAARNRATRARHLALLGVGALVLGLAVLFANDLSWLVWPAIVAGIALFAAGNRGLYRAQQDTAVD